MRVEHVITVFSILFFASCTLGPNSKSIQAVEPRLTPEAFISSDAAVLPVRTWLPDNAPSSVILALHGFNDYSNFIEATANFFTEHNIAVYAYDQRGFGAAPGRGLWPGRQILVDDFRTFARLLNEKYADVPLFFLGESMGGSVIMSALSDKESPRCDGVILVAPAVWSRSSMSFALRALLWTVAHTTPWIQLAGKSLKIKPSDNREMLINLGKDPLVIKKTRADTLYGLVNLMDDAYGSADRFDTQALILYGEQDQIIPKKPMQHVFNRIVKENSGRQRLIAYNNGYHMLLRDTQADIVRRDIYQWLNNPAAHFHSIQSKMSVEW